jgi:dolichol-phosphate mannosyltransferase
MMTGACITTWNEAQSIGALVRTLVGRGFSVFVVDDASQDNTANQAAAAGATSVAFRSTRAGIGPCLVQAWHTALAYGCTRIVQLDAGGSHDPLDADRLLTGLDAADVVIGSRFLPKSCYLGGPLYRPYLSRLAAMMCNFAQSEAHWGDWTSGYRAFRANALCRLTVHHYRAKMHGWQIEVLAHAGADGLRIVEAPITYRAGRSSFNARTAWEAFIAWNHVLHHVGAVKCG